MARRRKMTEERKAQFLELLWLGHTLAYASDIIGVHRNTVYQYRVANPEYDKEVLAALDGRVEIVEDALFANAVGGDTQAQKFWLMNRANDKWKSEQFLRHTGVDDDAPIQFRVVYADPVGDDEDFEGTVTENV